MNKVFILCVVSGLVWSSVIWAERGQNHHQGHGGQAMNHMTGMGHMGAMGHMSDHQKQQEGAMGHANQIQKVIYGAGIIKVIGQSKVTIIHEPISELGWPKMKMDFKVLTEVDLTQLKPGDRIHFSLVSSGGKDE